MCTINGMTFRAPPCIFLLPVWAFVACSRVSFTFYHEVLLKGNINVPKRGLYLFYVYLCYIKLNILAVEIIFIYDYFRWNL